MIREILAAVRDELPKQFVHIAQKGYGASVDNELCNLRGSCIRRYPASGFGD